MDDKRQDTYLSIPNAIEIIAFFTSFLIVFACGLKPSNIAKSSVFSAGITGVIAIFGIAWMTDTTFFLAHKAMIIDNLGGIVPAKIPDPFRRYDFSLCLLCS